MSENGDCMRTCGGVGTGAARSDKGERMRVVGSEREPAPARSDKLPTDPMSAVLYITGASGLGEREDIASIILGDWTRDDSDERIDTGVGGM